MLSDKQTLISLPQNHFSSLAARELYLFIRNQMLVQAEEFFKPVRDGLNLDQFRNYLDCYPFIRSQIRESMMPRMWSLTSDNSIPQLKYMTFAPRQDTKQVKADDSNIAALKMKTKKSSMVSLTAVEQPTEEQPGISIVKEANDKKQAKRSKSVSHNATCSPIKKAGSRGCIVPKDSIVVKEGDLLKVGKKTSTMRSRYYILRDNALFIYHNKD